MAGFDFFVGASKSSALDTAGNAQTRLRFAVRTLMLLNTGLMEVFAQSVDSGSIDDYSTFVDSTAIPDGYRIGLFFTIITNLALIPSIIITAPFSPAVYDKVTGKKIRKSQKRYFECFILIMTYIFSTLYHGCSYAGNMCTFWWLARRMDHFTAEYVIPMTSLYVLPIYPSRGHRHVAYFVTLLVHTFLQITQFATFIFQIVFLVIFIFAFAVFHYDNTELFFGVVLASIAIGFYLMPWGRIEPWTHRYGDSVTLPLNLTFLFLVFGTSPVLLQNI